MVFFVLLTLGFVFELGKNALTIDSRQTSSSNSEDTSSSNSGDTSSSNSEDTSSSNNGDTSSSNSVDTTTPLYFIENYYITLKGSCVLQINNYKIMHILASFY